MIRRVILSRKGVDSAAGDGHRRFLLTAGCSPCPFLSGPPRPIAIGTSALTSFRLAELLRLGGGRALHPNRSCHFDPMLEGALGLLGQHGAAQGELSRHEVGVGDLFLFFGWFRGTEDRRGSGCHHLFGWLQVTEVVRGTPPLRPSSKPLAFAILTAWETLRGMRRTRCILPGGACKALQGFVPGQPSGASRGPTQNLCSPNPGPRAAFGASPNRHSIRGFHPSGIGSTGLRRGLRGFSPGALVGSSSSMQRAAPTSLAGPWR